MKSVTIHQPVLVNQILKALQVAHLKGGRFIDATLGYAGHSLEIIKRGGYVLGIEYDERMYALAKARLEKTQAVTIGSDKRGLFKLALGNFRNVLKIAQDNGFSNVNGVLFDLGVSNYQLTHPDFGFSFKYPKAVLDMRADTSQKVTAADLLNLLRQDQLENLFLASLSENLARKISREIVVQRGKKEFKNIDDLLAVIKRLVTKKDDIHPATKIFLALRMAVNSEIDNLKEALPDAFSLIKRGGRIAVITFHSTEDQVVKDYFNNLIKQSLAKPVIKKPISPSYKEINQNPKARSAKLRVIEKII